LPAAAAAAAVAKSPKAVNCFRLLFGFLTVKSQFAEQRNGIQVYQSISLQNAKFLLVDNYLVE